MLINEVRECSIACSSSIVLWTKIAPLCVGYLLLVVTIMICRTKQLDKIVSA